MGTILKGLVVFAAILAVVVMFHWSLGTYDSEFGRYSDEGIHYLTGLTLHEFLKTPSAWTHPMAFARGYYNHYAKVGFTQWPPVFHLLQALWTFVFPFTRSSLLMLMSVLMASLAFVVYRFARIDLGRTAAIAAVAVTILAPLSQEHTAMIMTEVPLALFSLLAVLAWVKFLDRLSTRDAVWACAWSLLALMTKSNAADIALALGVYFLVERRWAPLKSRALWVVLAILAVVYVPYTLWTLKVTSQGWNAQDAQGAVYLWNAVVLQVGMAARSVGWPIAALAIVGFVILRASAAWRALGIYAASIIVFHCLVPTSIEPRKIYQIVPLLALGAAAAMERIARLSKTKEIEYLAVLPFLAVFLVSGYSSVEGYRPGLRNAVSAIRSQPDSKGAAILVASNPLLEDDEAAVTAEWAQYEPDPKTYVVRATKYLVVPPQPGAPLAYEPRATNTPEVRAALDELPIAYVLVTTTPARESYRHHEILRTALRESPDAWRKIYASQENGRTTEVYRNLAPWQGRPIEYEPDLSRKLGALSGAK